MADSNKYDGSQWEHSLRKLTTATGAVESPLYSDSTAITAYTIKGNTVQSGTLTPNNPVDVNGVGVRTINIYDGTTSATNARLSTSGTGTYAVQGWSVSSFIPIKSSTNYCTNLSTQSFYCLYDENKGFLVGGIISKANPSLGTYANAKFIRFDFQTNSLPEVQLSEGVSGQDYEPHGYRIPISSAGQTIDIYIGDLPLLKSLDGTAVDEINNGTLTRRVDSDGSVLPTPTTTQITMPSIPTTEGANSITVDTTVQPSEFTATWTGWHDANVKESDGSEWQ